MLHPRRRRIAATLFLTAGLALLPSMASTAPRESVLRDPQVGEQVEPSWLESLWQAFRNLWADGAAVIDGNG